MPDRYRQLFLTLADAVFLVDTAGSIHEANTAATWLLGSPAEEVRGRNLREFLAPDSVVGFNAKWQTLHSFERLEFETKCVTAAHAAVDVMLDVSHMPADEKSDEAEAAFLVIARQATPRDALQRELLLLRQCVERGSGDFPSAVFFVSARGEATRYPPPTQGQKSRSLDWIASILAGPMFKAVLDRAWAGEDVMLSPGWYAPPDDYAPEAETSVPAETGLARQRWLRISLLPIRLQGAAVTDVCARVLDETRTRLLLEEQRWYDQRRYRDLLAESLYHDLNNHLSVILAQASGLKLTTPPGQLPPSGVGAIIDAAQQAAGQLRSSSGAAAPEANGRHSVNLNSILPDCAAILAHWSKGRQTVTLELGQDIPYAMADDLLLKAMILAVGRHMEVLMPAGATLSLKTFRMPPVIAGTPAFAGLTIGDDTAAASTVRAPQPTDAGASVDIALARAIIRAYHGRCENISSNAQGMCWEIALPGSADQSAIPQVITSSRPQSASAVPTGPQCKVLLADDEENFRLFMSWALRERGFDVVAAKDGQEALERFQEAPETYHLVILDAYMPRMGGLEAYLRMQVLRQDLPVLFASGFARGPTVDAMVAGCPGPATVLLKPFSAEDLLGAVKKALAPR